MCFSKRPTGGAKGAGDCNRVEECKDGQEGEKRRRRLRQNACNRELRHIIVSSWCIATYGDIEKKDRFVFRFSIIQFMIHF